MIGVNQIVDSVVGIRIKGGILWTGSKVSPD